MGYDLRELVDRYRRTGRWFDKKLINSAFDESGDKR